MVNNEIFLGSGASTTFIPEQDIYLPCTGSGTTTTLTPEAAFTNIYKLVPDIYVGCTLDIYNTSDALVSSHTITSNNKTTLTLGSTPSTNGTVAYAIIRAYGAPAPHPLVSTDECLVADNWLGIMESVTFPNLSQELKQLNLGLGGSRNFTFQYKGIRTADNGSLALVANTGSWLYYAFGAMSSINFVGAAATTLAIAGTDVDADAAANNDIVIKASSATAANVPTTGPFFYRTVKDGTQLVPPLDFKTFDGTSFRKLPIASNGRPTDLITYTITELNTDLLPSFSLEQSMAKDPNTLTTNATTSVDESQTFTRIARGCRVNSMTIEAAEGEELKMTMDINARLVDSITDIYRDESETPNYVARAGVTDNANLFNFNAGTDFAAPFFFAEGTFSAFGQQFLKVNSVSITINNNLMDKRYMGGHRDMKEGIPAQRSYEISFEAVVTDDQLFKEMLNETENTTTNYVEFVFTKGGTSEQITLKFKDYFLDTTEITIPDDKGPISFSSTIKPRNLQECVVKTDYILMG